MTVLRRYSDQLPGKKLILTLSETTLFFSLDVYVELYAGCFNIELGSERAWPHEKLVSYN